MVPLKLACLKEEKEELDTLDLRPVIQVNSESRITAKKLNSPCPAIFSVSGGQEVGDLAGDKAEDPSGPSQTHPIKHSLSEMIFYFWLHHATCGIFVPQPGIELGAQQ